MKNQLKYIVPALALLCAIGAERATRADSIPYPNPGNVVPDPGQELFANGGDVTVTFLGRGGAAYTDILFLQSPGNAIGNIFNNQTSAAGDTVDLGTFAAGTEMEFGINVLNTGNTWFTGPSSRNADGIVHAYLVNGYNGDPNTTYVAFEDLASGVSDFNYQDVIFTMTGLTAATSNVPDASATLPLLGLGLAGLCAFSRRLRK